MSICGLTLNQLIRDLKVNISVPDELFIIEFPSGVPVYDFRIDKSFIVK